jgi:type II secretory pathway pseudopilin PulG
MFRSSRRGLTPAETLIVAAIVAIFALIISWRFVGEPSLEARTLTINRVEAVMEALERYAIDSGGVFPTTDEGLDALVTRPTDGDAPPRWSGSLRGGSGAPDGCVGSATEIRVSGRRRTALPSVVQRGGSR